MKSDAIDARARRKSAVRVLRAYGQPHRRLLMWGGLGAIGVASCRLALPWPLRWALEAAQGPAALPMGGGGDAHLLFWIAASYAVLALALGGSEHVLRLRTGRFTSLLVRDLRSDAVRGAGRFTPAASGRFGDISTRIIGDSTRLRSDLTGIAVHASTNGLLFAAVTLIMFFVSPPFGFIFLFAGTLALLVGLVTARAIEPNARKQREKESRFAATLRERIEGEGALSRRWRKSPSGDRKELRSTRLMTFATWGIHGIIGALVSAGLWFGVHEVRSGTLAHGELFLFAAYALTVHRRMVQVGRQVARTGKLVACANRLGALAASEGPKPKRIKKPLATAFRLVDIKLSSDRHRPRLSRMSLSIAAGSRVAVLGASGSGKSSLLRVMAGLEPEVKGALCWDRSTLRDRGAGLRNVVSYLGESTTFSRQPLWELAGLPSAAPPDDLTERSLRNLGAWAVMRRVSPKLSTRVSSLQLTTREARLLALARIALSDHSSIWALDGVLDSMSKKRARRCLGEIFARAGDAAVVISMGRAVELDQFDQIVVLRGGKLVFQGSPSDWRSRRATGEVDGDALCAP